MTGTLPRAGFSVISTAIRVARVGSAAELAAAVLMMLGYPCLMLAALVPSTPAFAAVAAVTYLADLYLHRKGTYLITLLNKVRAGLSTRFLVRELLLILLLARLDLSEEPVFYAAIACFTLFFGLQAPHGALVTLIGKRRQMPVVTRNVDLASRLTIPDAPPRSLLSGAGRKMLHLDLAAVAGLLVYALSGTDLAGYVGVGVTLVLGALYVALLVPHLRARRIAAQAGQGAVHGERLAARVPPGDRAVLLRLQGVRLPGQHVAGDDGAARLPAPDHPA